MPCLLHWFCHAHMYIVRIIVTVGHLLLYVQANTNSYHKMEHTSSLISIPAPTLYYYADVHTSV